MRTHSTPISTLQSPTSTPWRGLIGLLLVTLLLALGVLALNFAGAQAQPSAPPVAPVVASTEPAVEYVPNTALLKLKPGVALAAGDVSAAGAAVTSDAASLDGLLSALHVTAARPLFASTSVAAAQAGSTDATGLARIYRVQWSASIPVEHAVAALAADPAVEYAEPDYIARAARTPNDPEYAAQWALPKINAPAAWDVTTGAADVVIAIIDSGVDTAHPDFAGRLWQNDDPANGADDDTNGQVDDTNGWNILTDNGNLTDPSGHGSQVGGVAGAATDNGAGVAGMCWGCKLMFVNAMQASGVANYSDIAAAVQYAASNGAQVINLSLGGYADSAALRDAIREAATTAVIVAGAGNDDSSTPFYPAAYPEVLAVAATDTADQKAIFSNYGAWVDVSAPGKDIRTTTVSGYATDSGTSLAAPFVAGLAGLVRSQHPAWTAEQIKWQVLNTATAIDALNPTRAGQLGKGRIDAGAALTVDPQPRATVESYAIDGATNARPAPGQTFQLVLNVRNLWLLGQNLQGALSSSDPYVSITDGAGAFGDIAPGQPGSNSGDPFGVTVNGGAPYNHALQFTLTLSGAGGYSLAVPFSIQVRSAVETLGNTTYSADTTWTSDKTYVLAGAVIVNQGATLTIQPGTVIKGNPGKFIRVDGTLIARGTAAQPILFTTNSITTATWSGLRFADTAVDASYDAAGDYLAGSVLQFVEVSYADVAASLSTRSPYIADSTFSNNATSIQVGNNNNGGSPHIERNSFTGGNGMYGAIALSGGQPLIQQNSFVGGSIGIGNNMMMSSNGGPSILYNTFRNGGSPISVSGSPTLLGNVIQNNTGTAINVSCCGSNTPVIRDNVIVGNGGGINGSNLQLVDIEHNLVANNGGTGGGMCPPNCGGGAAVALDVQSSGFITQSNSVRNNTIIHNTGYGIQLGGPAAASVTIANNNLFGNGSYDLYLSGGQAGTQNFTVDAANNFWNVDASQIAGRIRDCTFDDNGCGTASSTVGLVAYNPPLANPDQTAPAYVRSVTMNPNPVGLQRGTATIDFSKPMAVTALPVASFHDARRGTTQQVFSDTAQVMASDVLGRLWFGLNNMMSGASGVRMYDGRQWTSYTSANSGLGSNDISSIYGAANGDVWFAHSAMGAPNQAMLSRLQGSIWITYPNTLPGIGWVGSINVIGQDSQGAMWFGAMNGAYRFDGATWRQYTTSDGLAANEVQRIVRDERGQVWFLATGMAGFGGGLSVFDGVTWTTHNTSTGMPANPSQSLFADSQGRVWVGLSTGAIIVPNRPYLAMYDGASWRYFGAAETNGRLSCDVNGIAESPDGTLWFRACGSAITYDGTTWSTASYGGGYTTAFLFDYRANLWYGDSMGGGTSVHWGGLDHPFTDGQWLSSTRFQAGYDFDANVPPGYYAVQTDGALDDDGMAAYATGNSTFQIDFGVGVTLDPPTPPQVAAQTDGSLTHLAASWQANSPNLDQYRYGIGTTPGARDIVGWTYLAGTSFARGDLALKPGQSYYVSVGARNTSGLWSIDAVSNVVIGGQRTASNLYLPAVRR